MSSSMPSRLHQLNPLLKLFGLVLLTAGILIYPSLLISILLLGLILLLFGVAGVHPTLSKKRTQFVIIFSGLLLLLQVLITPNGTILFFIIPGINGSMPLFPVTTYGLDRGLTISIRFLLIVLSSMLFVSVTDPTLLAHSLSSIKVPYRYAFALVIALRFLPLFDMENQTVRMAQRSRGLSTNLRSMSSLLRTIRYTFFPLLISALSRVDELSISMDGRGFGTATERSYYRRSRWTRLDSVVSVIVLSFFIFCVLSALGFVPPL